MAFQGDSVEHERSLEDQNEDIIKLLKAILIGIELIADQDTGSLIEEIED